MQAQLGNSDVVPRGGTNEASESRSDASWGAVFAAAAALSLGLFILGTCLGWASISPWPYNSAAAIGISTILWISLTQLEVSAVCGFMAGRLRTKSASLHTDAVYFRDTAHALLAWAVATPLTAMLVGGAVRAAMSGAIDVGASVAKATAAAGAGAASEASDSSLNPTDYFSDMLLRSDKAPVDGGNARSEVVRIFATSLQADSLGADDRAHLARVVAARTGLAQAEAEKRVDEVYTRVTTTAANAKEAAHTARKATSGAALWMTVALLLGAFVAAMAATFGGKMRDDGATPLTTRRR